jgi:hypothetical protein
MEEQKTIFRKKTLERISSPDQLTDYLCVTNPKIWVILAAIIALLVGLLAWGTIGTLETSAKVKVIVEEHMAQVIPLGSERLGEGMPLCVASQETVIASTGTDDFGRVFGVAELTLPDGMYDGTVVVEKTRPIDFLLESR